VRPLGSPESVNVISQADLQAAYDQHYTPHNISLVAVGGMTLEELTSLISESPFGISKSGRRTPLEKPIVLQRPKVNRHVFELSKHVVANGPVESSKYHTMAKLPGNVHVTAAFILRKMLRERLQEEIREKRAWSYHVGVNIEFLHGLWFMSIDCLDLNPKALESIEDVVEMVVVGLAERKELFDRMVRHALMEANMLDFSGQDVRNHAFGYLEQCHRIVTIAETFNAYQRLTFEDIRSLLKWLAPEWRWTLIEKP
jgi:predicted Zn-dependent peptidase